MEHHFDKADESNEFTREEAEILAIINRKDVKPTPAEYTKLFKFADTDNNGRVTKEEMT